MSTGAIPPVVPSAAGTGSAEAGVSAGGGPRRAALPLSAFAVQPRTRSTVYGLAAVDNRGRIAERAVLRAMGWSAGMRLRWHERGGLVVVVADPRGGVAVTRQGHLQLPAAAQRACAVAAGDRVLVAAEPGEGVLIVHPVAALDAMLTRFHAVVLGGDPA
ncbi:MAG: AbrB/MazE/SpoVT family DNA-binding domain-containing protein [Sciscionella sp.]